MKLVAYALMAYGSYLLIQGTKDDRSDAIAAISAAAVVLSVVGKR